MKYIIERLQERSTWIGLTTAVGAVGVAIDPDLTERIIQTGIAVFGVIFLLTKDKELPVIVKHEGNDKNEQIDRRAKKGP